MGNLKSSVVPVKRVNGSLPGCHAHHTPPNIIRIVGAAVGICRYLLLLT